MATKRLRRRSVEPDMIRRLSLALVIVLGVSGCTGHMQTWSFGYGPSGVDWSASCEQFCVDVDADDTHECLARMRDRHFLQMCRHLLGG